MTTELEAWSLSCFIYKKCMIDLPLNSLNPLIPEVIFHIFFFSSCFPWFGLFCIEVHSDWTPKGYAVHLCSLVFIQEKIGLFMTNIALCFSEKYAICGVKCVVCSRFSMSYTVFRLLCIFCWVKFVLRRSPRLYLCFTSQFDPDGFRQPHQQPVIALSANCTYHPQDISNTHAPQHTGRNLTNTC